MPMLTTLRMRFPVCPCHSPLRTRSAEAGHAVEHGVYFRHDIHAVDQDRRIARRAQGGVQHGSIFSDVDLLAAKHRLNACRQLTFVGELHEQPQRLVGDAIF